MKTVILEKIDQNSIRMVWQKQPRLVDIRAAFKEIEDHLNETNTPLYIIVILPPNIRFPVGQTVWEALGCYRHEQSQGWLVVGGNSLAKLIESILVRMTKRENVLWFESESEALAHLASINTAYNTSSTL